jgi:hypothetical protein
MFYFPELDYWFKKYWETRGEITIEHVNIPETLDVDQIQENSIFELLFSDVYDYDKIYLEMKIESITSMPRKVLDRLSVKKNRPTIYVSTESDHTKTVEENLELTPDDISVLEQLYNFKSGSEVDNWYLDEFQPFTKLSTMIQIYIKMRLNNDFSFIPSIESMYDPDNKLNVMYYLYLINESHRYLKTSAVMIDSNTVRFIPVRKFYMITENDVSVGYFSVSDPEPYNTEDIYVYLNSELLKSGKYNVVWASAPTDTTKIYWGSDVLVEVGDNVIIDYYTVSEGNE